jgi:transcriptional regulator with XRE-family HTH domain
MDIETLLKARRKALGLTQMRLAIQAGVSLPTIQNLEAKKGNPTIGLLEKISTALGCSLEMVSNEPDWGLLQRAGLPFETEEGPVSIGEGMPSRRDLAEHLFRAVD